MGDPNFGFLRPKAYLAIVMVTNEDDCSTPPNYSSDLFNPGTDTVANPSGLGGLQSWRCNEFGHLCNGAPPPHIPPAPGTTVTLTGCTSSEGMSPGPGGSAPEANHQLIKVNGTATDPGFVDFLKGLKEDPTTVLVAALAGPATPYIVAPTTTMLVSGGSDIQPSIGHSCTQNSGEYADPGVRIKNWLDAFGANGVFEHICANDFAPAMTAIATAIGKKLSAQCVTGTVMIKTDGTTDPDCDVTYTSTDSSGHEACPGRAVLFPAAGGRNAGSWPLPAGASWWTRRRVPRRPAGFPTGKWSSAMTRPATIRPLNQANAAVSCALCPSRTVPQGDTDPALGGNQTTCP